MTTKAKSTKKSAKDKVVLETPAAPMTGPIHIAPIATDTIRVRVSGMTGSPYCCHAFTKKAILEMEAKHNGETATRKKDPKDQWNDFIEAGHWTYDAKGKITSLCAPALQFKKATVDAVRHVGDRKTLTMAATRSWFYIKGTDPKNPNMVPLTAEPLPKNLWTDMDYRFAGEEEGKKSQWVNDKRVAEMKRLHQMGVSIRRDAVTVGMGKDLRYRPIIHNWTAEFDLEYHPNQVTLEGLMNLINTGGSLNGIGEWRPSSPKACGDWGRYTVEAI